MPSFLLWYLIITLVGWLAFPLTFRLLPGLAGRGYAFSRILGLLVWGYLYWMLGSLGVLKNDTSGLILSLGILVALSGYAYSKTDRAGFTEWWADHRPMVIVVEALFLAAFVGWTIVRAMNPEIAATEKPMELAFLNAILRSPTFPPHDPWLSGYAISYYYFGFVLVAMLAMLAGTSAGIAFNLGIALIFGLVAVGAYGVVYALLNGSFDYERENHPLSAQDETETGEQGDAARNTQYAIRDIHSSSHPTFSALLGPLLILLVSNVEGFLDMLHARGMFWVTNIDNGTQSSRFWAWLNLKDLVNPPGHVVNWVPPRFLWWWRASRVVNDLGFTGGQQEVIDEFPFFSFLLSDLHPHVMAIPFVLLAIGLALNYFLRKDTGEIRFSNYVSRFTFHDFLFTALALGALAFLNTWDFPIYVALFAGAYALRRAGEVGWDWGRAVDFIGSGFLLGLAGVLLYFPFYIGFSSQAGGLLPNVINPTRGAHLWVMFGTLFVPVFLALMWAAWRGGAAIGRGLGWGFGIAIGLWAVSLVIVFGVGLFPGAAQAALSAFGAPDLAALMGAAISRRLAGIGGFLTLALLLSLAIALLLPKPDSGVPSFHPSVRFSALLVIFATLLILGPEFIYLRDLFGTRMNTVFKFYYQAWMLLGLAAAWGAGTIFRRCRGLVGAAGSLLVIAVILIGLVYPVLSLITKTDGAFARGLTLDGTDHGYYLNSDDHAAVDWLLAAPYGTLVEAVGGSYSNGGRMATHTGLPNVLGWIFHEGQWRGGYEEVGSREGDIAAIYGSSSWEDVRPLLDLYGVRYIYLGSLERSTYAVSEAKFRRNLEVVFEFGQVVIFEYEGGE